MPDTTQVPVKQTQVVIVDDHPMFREHLSALINRDLNMSVCGEADNVKDAFTLIQRLKPDIAIVDITLRGSSGLELLKDLKAQGIDIPVLVLSMHDEELYAERALRAGARGYITKREASAEVVVALRRVLAGDIHVSKQMATLLIERIASRNTRATAQSSVNLLADRELEVFQMLGRGKSTREIAAELHLGETTVDTYRARIKEKLGLRGSTELYLRASQWVRDNGA